MSSPARWRLRARLTSETIRRDQPTVPVTDATRSHDSFPLTDEDRAILAKESPTIAGHTCKVLLLGSSLDLRALRASVSRRLVATPTLTRRLGGSPSAPRWVPDDAFSIEEHIVQSPHRAPLSEEELKATVASLFAERLDRQRPLWRIDIVGPLWDGGTALVWRVHHALADGATWTKFAAALLWDLEKGPSPRPGALARVAAAAEDSQRRHRRSLVGVLRREFGRAPGLSPFDGRIGSHRRVSFASASLPHLRAAAKAIDRAATVNDAVLACVAGGLRRWLGLHDRSVGVRCKVPVSLHRVGDEVANRDSFFYVDLPVTDPDPAGRLRAIRQETAVRKRRHDAEEVDRLLRALGHTSPHLRTMCERLLFDPRRFAINVSTVRGPSEPVSVLGEPVRRVYAIADIAERHAVRVTAFSLADQLNFGFCADADLIHDLDRLAAAVAAEADELTGAAGSPSAAAQESGRLGRPPPRRS